MNLFLYSYITWKFIKNLNSRTLCSPFEKSLNYRKDRRLLLCPVYITCISELHKNKLLFFTTNDIREKMYCEQRGKIFNFTNNSLQDFLLPTSATIRITLFCNLKIQVLRGELPQKTNYMS
jgi:hypothetical protein